MLGDLIPRLSFVALTINFKTVIILCTIEADSIAHSKQVQDWTSEDLERAKVLLETFTRNQLDQLLLAAGKGTRGTITQKKTKLLALCGPSNLLNIVMLESITAGNKSKQSTLQWLHEYGITIWQWICSFYWTPADTEPIDSSHSQHLEVRFKLLYSISSIIVYYFFIRLKKKVSIENDQHFSYTTGC